MVKVKKQDEQSECSCPSIFPVSIVALVPIKNIPPAIPKTVPSPGRYFLILITASCACCITQKYVNT